MSLHHAIDSTIRIPTLSDGHQIIEAMKPHLHDVTERAFGMFPLDSAACTTLRWKMIEKALNKARASIQVFVILGFPEVWHADDAKINARGANSDFDKAAVLRDLAAYLAVYERTLAREMAHAG